MKAYSFFENQGAERVIAEDDFIEKAKNVKALVFDWDGVFHSGRKDDKGVSTFSEVDSMGVAMLRFGYYLHHGEMPKTIIVSGERNPTAFALAKRDRFDAVFFKITHKIIVAELLERLYGISLSEILFVFDDILDLSLAAKAGLRLMVKRSANPLLIEFCKERNLADYYTAHDGANHALRECSELILDTLGLFETTIKERVLYQGEYALFLKERNAIDPHFYTYNEEGDIERADI